MNKYLLIAALVFCAFTAKSQTNDDLTIDTIKREAPKSNGAQNYSLIQSTPEFPGGINSFFTYFSQSLHIPSDQAVKGIVKVSFSIGATGSVLDPIIIEGILTRGAKKEIIRVFNESPKWKPAIQNGKPVKLTFTIPINFGV